MSEGIKSRAQGVEGMEGGRENTSFSGWNRSRLKGRSDERKEPPS